MKLVDARMLFLDLQTTGASPATGAPLEIAWMLGSANDQQPDVVTKHLLKQPDDVLIPKRIQSITGITDQHMEHAVAWDYVEKQLRAALLESHVPAFVIHYAQFERPFLTALLSETDITWETICTHQIARRLFPNLPSRGIRGLAGYFGFPLDECKRAETHVTATFAIWRHLCQLLAEKSVNSEEELSQWLVESPSLKRTAYEYPLDRGLRLSMPDCPGVYKMISRRGDVLYVGKATSLRDRVNSYFRGRKNRDPRKLEMLTQAWDIKIETCPTVLEACLLEVQEIKRLSPPYNIALNTGLRPLLFYSPDFASQSNEQSLSHPVGPFRTELVLDAFVCLMESLNTENWNQGIFFDELPVELLEEGFQVFIQRHAVERRQLLNPRSVLALGAWLYRRQRSVVVIDGDIDNRTCLCGASCNCSGAAAPAAATSAVQSPSPLPDPAEEVVVTAEDVADKFERLAMRAASAYRLTRRLTRLLNSTITFRENSVERVLRVVNGALVEPEHESTRRTFAWQGLEIEEFDRMRVLSTELNRLRATGQFVLIS